MTRRFVGVLAVGLVCVLIGCGDSSPVAPTPPEAPSSPAALPTNILLRATPESLPANGGGADVVVRVVRRLNGDDIAMPGVVVKLTALDGEVSTAELTTNDDGEGTVRWTSRTSGTVVARAGTLSANILIPVEAAPLPPAPPTTPPAPPNPGPPAPIPPGPTPTPGPLTITLTPSPATANVGDTVTWTAAATIPASEGTLRQYEWSFDGAAPIINGQSVMTQRYTAAGTHTATVTVRSTTWAHGTASGSVTVSPVPPPPPPALSVTLSAVPTTGTAPMTADFTAAPANLQSGETVLVYQWDLDGNGSFEGTSPTNTRQHTYADGGVLTAKVKILTSTDRTAEGTVRIIVNN